VAVGLGRHGMPPPASDRTGCAKTAHTDHVTLRPRPLTPEAMAPVANADRRPPSVHQV